jgi:small subunit ribosomal protein S16
MLKMRLQRFGRKNNPSYRVLIVDSRQGPKSGKFIDLIGSYDPKNNRIAIDGEKAKTWIQKGVQVSPTVHNLLISQKIIEGKKINVLPRKSPIKKEDEATETPVAEAPVSAAVENQTEEAVPEVSVEETPIEETAPEMAVEEVKDEPVAAE